MKPLIVAPPEPATLRLAIECESNLRAWAWISLANPKPRDTRGRRESIAFGFSEANTAHVTFHAPASVYQKQANGTHDAQALVNMDITVEMHRRVPFLRMWSASVSTLGPLTQPSGRVDPVIAIATDREDASIGLEVDFVSDYGEHDQHAHGSFNAFIVWHEWKLSLNAMVIPGQSANGHEWLHFS